MSDIHQVVFSRVGVSAAARTFDIRIVTRSGPEYMFTSLNKEEHEGIEAFLTEKKIKVKNEMVQDVDMLMAAVGDDDDDEMQSVASSDDSAPKPRLGGDDDEDSEAGQIVILFVERRSLKPPQMRISKLLDLIQALRPIVIRKRMQRRPQTPAETESSPLSRRRKRKQRKRRRGERKEAQTSRRRKRRKRRLLQTTAVMNLWMSMESHLNQDRSPSRKPNLPMV